MTLETVKYNISSRFPVENEELAIYIAEFTKCALATAQKRLVEGKRGFFYAADLSFESNRRNHARKLRRFIAGLLKRGLDVFIIGITESQTWYDVEEIDDFEVDLNRLLQQLKVFEKKL